MPRNYGVSVMRASPTAIKKSRAAMNHGLGITNAGGCTYTALKMHNYDHKDPALVLPLQTVSDFAQGIACSGAQMILQSVWGDLTKALKEACIRWSKVIGPVSAAVVTLLDLNWSLQDFDRWTDFAGVEWKIDYRSPNVGNDIKEILS